MFYITDFYRLHLAGVLSIDSCIYNMGNVALCWDVFLWLWMKMLKDILLSAAGYRRVLCRGSGRACKGGRREALGAHG